LGLRGTRYKGTGGNYTVRSFMVATHQQMLFGRANEEE